MNKSSFDINHQNNDVESKIIASLERISEAFRVLLWKESKEFSLSPIQIQVLIFLLHHSSDKRKVSYLSKEFNMTKATISDTIRTLYQKKLIEKIHETSDTRSYIINLSEKGEKIAKKTSLFAEEIKMPISKMMDEDKDNLLLNLLTIIKHLNHANIITIQRMCFSCQYYKKNENEHFCKLLNAQLSTNELRVDCPDYLTA